MRRLPFLAVAAAAHAPAWAHHSPIHLDIACTTGEPGLALVPFVLLVAVGTYRAVRRHRKDR
jgi:hypothetical protein